MKIICCFLLLVIPYSVAQPCNSEVAESQRRDCQPWAGDQSSCEARGCVWCETSSGGVPWCFINDDACPSTIPEESRVDCHPDAGSNRDACAARGCVWCPASNPTPWCFYDDDIDQGGNICPSFPESERVDCQPTDGETQQQCVNKGCYWCEAAQQNAPYCFVTGSIGYKMIGAPQATTKGYRVNLQRVNFPSWFSEEIATIAVDVEFHEVDRLRIKIFDPANDRFEVPQPIPSPNSKAPNPLYDVIFTDDPAFNIRVDRVATGETIFDTSLGGLQFADQFLQFTTRLPSSNVYGFGETEHATFRHDMFWKKWGMWARDEPVTDVNIYGVHPFMTVLDSQGNSNGLLILNSNAQEIQLTPAPGLVYRTTGGILDIYLFLGPTPEEVIQQYTQAIGYPAMPPYWMLGFHLARYGYNTLGGMVAAVDRMREHQIPHDVQHGDIDYFDSVLSFTWDQVNFAGLPEYIRRLKTEGTRFITLLDPFISNEQAPGTYPPFDNGMLLDVWMKESDNVTNAESTCWPGTVFYPDFSKQAAVDWWINECVTFHDTIEFDALWIDMNEPASFSEGSTSGCNDNDVTRPLFKPKAIRGSLADKTLCADYLSVFGNHYNTHSLYGWSCGVPASEAASVSTGKRSYAIIRSTFPGLGKYGGKWLGDNNADWGHMRKSVIGILEFNLFGIPFVGADICGYFGDSYPALCKRWMQVGSFYTFSRNHNGINWQSHDPGFWPDVAAVSRDTLLIRYTLLPYLYTLFHNVHTRGGTVLRSLVHEFPSDSQTWDIDRQFLWGSAFLITPVLDEFAITVNGYFPVARWYSYYDGVELAVRGGFSILNAPVDFIPLHFRGGYVIPTQEPSNSTMWSRSNSMGLVVPLDEVGEASGTLFWDDGDSKDTYQTGDYFLADYTVSGGVLTGSVTHDGYSTMEDLKFANIDVYGLTSPVTSVTVDGSDWLSFTYNDVTKVLNIDNLDITVRSSFSVTW